MDSAYLKTLEKYLDPETYAKLFAPEKETSVFRSKQFLKATEDCKNPKLKLLCALLKAEERGTREDILAAAKEAARQDDFLTALYWHKKVDLKPVDAQERFTRLCYAAAAEEQKKHVPDAEPLTTYEKILPHQTETAKQLGNRAYSEAYQACQTKQVEIYCQEFDSIETSVVQTALNKIKKADASLSRKMGLLCILTLVWLIYSVPKVWMWSFHFFLDGIQSILFPLFWLVPLLYAALVVVGVVLFLSMDGNLEKAEKSLRVSLKECGYRAEDKLHRTEEYARFHQMDMAVPEQFRPGGKRLVLATVSAMYGEENLYALGKLADAVEQETWLTRFAGNSKPEKRYQYQNAVEELIRKDASLGELCLACALYCKEKTVDERKSWFNENVFEYGITPVAIGRSMWYERSTDYQNWKRMWRILIEAERTYRLLEYRAAKESGDTTRLGEVCCLLYMMYRQCTFLLEEHARERMYFYGTEGIEYSDKLRYEVMKEAIKHRDYESGDEYSLDYTRRDAERYISQLKERNDPRVQELETLLKERIEWEEDQKRWEDKLEEMEREKREERRARARAELEAQADRFERDANMWLGNGYETESDRLVKGEISYHDYMIGEELRNKAIDKKLQDMSDGSDDD